MLSGLLDLVIRAYFGSGFAPWQKRASYHIAVATQMDHVFQDVFVHKSQWPRVSLSQHVGNVLRLCDSLIPTTYSDAKNVLTGAIDQPEICEGIQEISSRLLFRFW